MNDFLIFEHFQCIAHRSSTAMITEVSRLKMVPSTFQVVMICATHVLVMGDTLLPVRLSPVLHQITVRSMNKSRMSVCQFSCLELPGGPSDGSSLNETGEPILPNEGYGKQ